MKIKNLLIILLVLVVCSTVVYAGFFTNLKSLLGISSSRNQNMLQPKEDLPSYQPSHGRETGAGEPSEVLEFSVLYKAREAPARIRHYMDFVGSANDFMQVNSNLEQLFVSAMKDDLFELNLVGDMSWIKTKWKINDENKFSALGEFIATEEADELNVYDLMQLVADGQTNNDVTLTSGVKVKNPKNFGSNDRVKFISAPANEGPASGQYTVELDTCADLSDAEGYGSCEKALRLETSKQDGFILTGNVDVGNVESKEVYIVVKGLAVFEEEFPTCDNNVDDDNDGYVDNEDATCESCTDNDAGINTEIASMALVTISPDMPQIAYVDSCYEGNLVEAVCFEDGTHFVTVACPEGKICYRGACVDMDSDVLYTTYGDYRASSGNVARMMQRALGADSLVPGFKKKVNHVNRAFELARKK